MHPHQQQAAGIDDRLRWEGEMFRLLAENVVDYAIFLIDPQRRVITWTRGAQRLLGYGEAEMLGQSIDRLFTPEDLEAGEPATEVLRAVAFGRGEDDRWHVRKDGSRFWCSGVLTPLRDAAGQVRAFAKIMRDLTPQKLAEDRLRASEARLQTLSDSNILGVGVTHADGRILEANDEYLRLIGHTRDELAAGRVRWDRLTPQEYLPLDEVAVAQALRDGACTPYEKEYIRHGDGARVPVQIAFSQLQDTPGTFVFYVVDLAGIKAVQDELRQANKRKDEFLAVLGHELRNPLAPMLNAVHVLHRAKRTQDEAVALHAVNLIERQVRHMTRLVDDLLEVARMTLGKVELQPQPLELHAAVNGVLETVRPALEARRHRLQVDLAPEPLWLRADPVRIAQILANVLANAIKYTDPGGTIAVRVRREGRMARIEVQDSGIGMDAQTLSHVFEPFAQAERGRGHSQGGLGVGLALVRRFTELHGGSVSAHSGGHGAGTTFTVCLPLSNDKPAAVRDQRERVGTSPGVRVLVVDDNVDAADSLKMVLEMAGHSVRVAHSGDAGLQLASDWEPQAVLLDIGLPGMSGYDVAQALRRDARFGHVFLAAATGYGQPQDIERAHAAGFDRHFVKPVDPVRVLEALKAAVAPAAG